MTTKRLSDIIGISESLKGNLKLKESTVAKLRQNLQSIREMLNDDKFVNKTNQVEKIATLKSMSFDITDIPYVQTHDKSMQ